MNALRHETIIARAPGLNAVSLQDSIATIEARLADLTARYNAGIRGVAAVIRRVDDLRRWQDDLLSAESLLWCEGFLVPRVDFDADPEGYINAWAEFLRKVHYHVDPGVSRRIESAWQQFGVPS